MAVGLGNQVVGLGIVTPGSNHRILRSGAKSRNCMATWSCHRIPGAVYLLEILWQLGVAIGFIGLSLTLKILWSATAVNPVD